MNKAKILLLGTVLLAGFAIRAAIPASGSCESKAVSIAIGGTKSVTLVNEYDPDEKEFYDSGAMYMYVTLRRGNSYTLWMEGGDAAEINLNAYPRDTTESEDDRDIWGPSASFDDSDEQSGKFMNWLHSEDWDDEDPVSWKYYICLTGNIGARTTVHLVQGEVSFKPDGLSDNPLAITISQAEARLAKSLTDEKSFYFKANLTAGRKYYFRTAGGTAASPLTLAVDSNYDWLQEPDPRYAGDATNPALVIYPQETGAYELIVSGDTVGRSFTLFTQVVPVRSIDKHPYTDLENGVSAIFQPGRMVADLNYHDDIIDEHLFRIKLAKGERWMFNATGATCENRMVLYNSKGEELMANQSIGSGSLDTRIGFEATAAGYYYIGVCDPALAPTNTPVCADVTMTAVRIENLDGDNVSLAPLPGVAEDDPADFGSQSDPYSLDSTHWTKTFVIGGRKGIAYKLASEVEEGFNTDFTLSAKVFTLSGTTEQTVESYGSLNPGEQLTFEASKNQPYYVRVSVAEGFALDYPEFCIYALAYSTSGEDLGILTVNALGTPAAAWYLDNESSSTYPSGASVLVAGTHKVTFKPVSNFTTPAAIASIAVKPGVEPTVIETYYSDTADPTDDRVSGTAKIDGKNITYRPTTWSLRNTDSSYDRTLWKNDEADNFTFDGTDGYFYDFKLEKLEGDARFMITNATPYKGNGGVFAAGVQEVSKLVLPKAKTKYIFTVYHEDPASPSNGFYRVTGKYANVGAIKFSNVKVSAREDAASVKLTVNRTARDGRVRVKYQTIADTALPGVDYVAQRGVLEWAANDNKAKDIIIKLIPDLVPTYEGANKTFFVKLEPIPEDERAADEYEAAFTMDSRTGEVLDTATVTLTEASRATPGTVQVAGITTPKKPVFTVTAGETLAFELERVSGADGDIEVLVDATTLNAGKQTLAWADGESAAKKVSFVIPTDEKDFKTSKTAQIRLTATSMTRPTFAAASISVTVKNEKFEITVADWSRLPEAKTCGYTIREARSGTWFLMDDGSFENLTGVGDLTFTLTRPCVFTYAVDGVDQDPVKVALGMTQSVVVKSGAKRVTFDYLYNGGVAEQILQGVKYGYDAPVADGTAKSVRITAGKLPDGIKVEQDRTTKEWFVRGVPTKAGYFCAVVTDSTDSRNPVEIGTYAFNVIAAGTSIGTFNGLLEQDGSALTNGFPSIGTVKLTMTTAGRLSASVAVGGRNYSFSGTGFDEAVELDAVAGKRLLTAELPLVQKVGTVTYTNVLTVALTDGADTDLDLLGAVIGSVELKMAVPDDNNRGAQEDIVYRAELYRDNAKNADYLAAFAAFKGYYTVSLPIVNPEEGKPQGNGYLTLTLNENGTCRTAGKLADGTSISSSLTPALIGDLADPETCEVLMPVYMARKPMVFGGVLHIRFVETDSGEVLPVVDSTACLRWASDNAALTYYGDEGWNYELSPAGGWYDTVYNLQTYFLNHDFSVDAGASDELPAELLTSGYKFISETMPTGQALWLEGNKLVVDRQVLVKDPVTRLNLFGESVNPSGVTVSFNRATGVLTGAFSVWSDGADARGNTVQRQISGFKHEGVLLLSRDAFSLLDPSVWTAGYYLAPGVTSVETKKRYIDSRPFNVISTDLGDIDAWAEDGGWNPDWGEKPTE